MEIIGIDYASGPDRTVYWPYGAIVTPPTPEQAGAEKERRWQQLRDRILAGDPVRIIVI